MKEDYYIQLNKTKSANILNNNNNPTNSKQQEMHAHVNLKKRKFYSDEEAFLQNSNDYDLIEKNLDNDEDDDDENEDAYRIKEETDSLHSDELDNEGLMSLNSRRKQHKPIR